MDYIKELKLKLNEKTLITVTGSGGKTTIIDEIAEILCNHGKKVLVTTSTKILFPKKNNSIVIMNKEILENIKISNPEIIYGAKEYLGKDKLGGFDCDEIDDIKTNGNFDFIIVEGDGSKGKSLKGYEAYEPVIPKTTDILIAVIGLDIIGKTVNDSNIHRVNNVLSLINKNIDENVDYEDILELIRNKDGYFKYHVENNYLILNKVNEQNRIDSEKIKKQITGELVFLSDVLFRKETE